MLLDSSFPGGYIDAMHMCYVGDTSDADGSEYDDDHSAELAMKQNEMKYFNLDGFKTKFLEQCRD